MQAIELAAEIDQNQQIHLQLPKTIHAHKAKVIVMYEEAEQLLKPISLGLFKGKIQLSDDFNEALLDSFWLAWHMILIGRLPLLKRMRATPILNVGLWLSVNLITACIFCALLRY